jgi:hypothetical protein
MIINHEKMQNAFHIMQSDLVVFKPLALVLLRENEMVLQKKNITQDSNVLSL